MGKALLIASTTNAIAGNFRAPFGGLDGFSGTEVNSQVSAPEGFTISRLAAFVRTLPGTSSLTVRKNGANGNGTVSFSATGLQVDTTNTDSFSATDLFNFTQSAVTVANPTFSWFKANVELDSGHGNFHIAANPAGTIYDLDSATRYLTLAGSLQADGQATEANSQWKNRGNTSIAGFQAYVIANARTSDTILRTRVNGSNGGLTLTIGAGVTGLIQATGTPDTLADGDLYCLSIEYGTGSAEDLTLGFVAALLKSTSNKSETFNGIIGQTRSASGTEHFLTPGGRQTTYVAVPMTEEQARVPVGFAATVSNPRVYLSANTYSADATLTVYKNGVSAATVTITASGGAGWYENTSDTFTIDEDDTLSFGIAGGTTGSITPWQMGLTFSPLSGGKPYYYYQQQGGG